MARQKYCIFCRPAPVVAHNIRLPMEDYFAALISGVLGSDSGCITPHSFFSRYGLPLDWTLQDGRVILFDHFRQITSEFRRDFYHIDAAAQQGRRGSSAYSLFVVPEKEAAELLKLQYLKAEKFFKRGKQCQTNSVAYFAAPIIGLPIWASRSW